MLQTVVAEMHKQISSTQTFNHMYKEYILSVQDYNIQKEIKHLTSRNVLSVHSIERLVRSAFEVLGGIYE